MKREIIKKHKGMEPKGFIKTSTSRKYMTTLEHSIEYDDKNVIITAAVKFDRNDPKLIKIINDMEKKQESPVITLFKKLEKENRHDIEYQENGVMELYSNPFEE